MQPSFIFYIQHNYSITDSENISDYCKAS